NRRLHVPAREVRSRPSPEELDAVPDLERHHASGAIRSRKCGKGYTRRRDEIESSQFGDRDGCREVAEELIGDPRRAGNRYPGIRVADGPDGERNIRKRSPTDRASSAAFNREGTGTGIRKRHRSRIGARVTNERRDEDKREKYLDGNVCLQPAH